MRTSLQKLDKKIKSQINLTFFQLIADLRHPSEAQDFFQALFTPAEQSTFTKRLAIVLKLRQGETYQQIKDSLKVSSATISKVQDSLNHSGFDLASRKIKINQWAGHWAQKLLSPFKNKT